MPMSSIIFTPSRTREPRHEEHEPISDICPIVIFAAAAAKPISFRNGVGERVVELQRDAEQERPEHEHRERPVLHERQRVQPEHVAPPRACPPRACGGVCGSVSASKRHEHRRAGADPQRQRRRVGAHEAIPAAPR
jgi:hypothetical protein